ncbi:MAG: addiction module toxin RelE [Azoarcus sp.]|jgi:mRNA-degrading endonuclease RelE of RelBE toxin-antitoxin system|nr:addiction module toxin RelE [Azoarcus sp.]
MYTIIESPIFTRYWPDYWTEDERGEFAAFLADNPKAGVVVPGSGGCRKIRQGIEGKGKGKGKGKSGGVRVIYTTRLKKGVIVVLTI